MGRFPHHHPDPTVEKNLTPLKREIKKGGFAFGFAFDGDGGSPRFSQFKSSRPLRG